jgi:hypothetical protein
VAQLLNSIHPVIFAILDSAQQPLIFAMGFHQPSRQPLGTVLKVQFFITIDKGQSCDVVNNLFLDRAIVLAIEVWLEITENFLTL